MDENKYRVPQQKVTVDFTQVAVAEYLDKCIGYWRDVRDGYIHSDLQSVADCYIDAYQSVRVSLFGSTKP